MPPATSCKQQCSVLFSLNSCGITLTTRYGCVSAATADAAACCAPCCRRWPKKPCRKQTKASLVSGSQLSRCAPCCADPVCSCSANIRDSCKDSTTGRVPQATPTAAAPDGGAHAGSQPRPCTVWDHAGAGAIRSWADLHFIQVGIRGSRVVGTGALLPVVRLHCIWSNASARSPCMTACNA